MNESIRDLFERQARWQESRKDLPWEEKIRLVEQVRDEVARWLPAYRRRTIADSNPENDPRAITPRT